MCSSEIEKTLETKKIFVNSVGGDPTLKQCKTICGLYLSPFVEIFTWGQWSATLDPGRGDVPSACVNLSEYFLKNLHSEMQLALGLR